MFLDKKDVNCVRCLSDGMDSIVPVVVIDSVLYLEINSGKQN